jgi:hypothetical protein
MELMPWRILKGFVSAGQSGSANLGDAKTVAAEGHRRVVASVSVGTTTVLGEPSKASLRYSGLL